MTYLLAIAVLGLGYLLLQTRSRLQKLEHRQIIGSKILNAIIFAVYNKRKDDIKERLIEIADIEEAVRVVTAQKRPELDTPIEDLAYILGDEMPIWKKHIRDIEWDKHEKEENEKKDFFIKVRAKFSNKNIPDWAIYRMWHDKMEVSEETLGEVMKWQEIIDLLESNKE